MASISLNIGLAVSLLMLVASFVAFMNLAGMTSAIIRQRKGEPGGHSNVAGVSLFLCVIAWLVASDTVGLWALLPAFLDPGTWSIIILPFYLIWRWKKHGSDRK